MNYLSRMQRRWSQTAEEAQVQGKRCDEAPRQMPEDQRVIWKRLNEIRLSQDQSKVPALKGIAKRRIREELQVVEEVAAQIQTKDISETNRLLYATAVVVTERLGIKPGKRKASKVPCMVEKTATRTGGSAAKRPQPTRASL